ncbi:MAG: alpha-glucosidase [Lachnospiraceae bacterium]|jgi:oligo-1,6-glucosidase|nr:alpha-glucosidase [Lachnospiraceae bacterium]
MRKWWQERVVYQIYPRSFQDTNGDGVGDIPGIIMRLPELKELGVGILWLSPIYKSPGVDNGYDISDYRDIDPLFGTMADMERLLAEAEKLDIRIIMDLVINHTSDQHEWFQKSRDQDSRYRDYYIWKPGRRNGKPPNNWTAFFMGSVWEYDQKSGEYYLHLFHRQQPDLNYDNPLVIAEVKDIMRFWLDKGVAGFRLDVINIIYKASFANGKPSLIIRGLEHYKSQEGNHQILRELRREILDKYDSFTVGETVMVDLQEAKELCDRERGELDMLFYFDHLEVDRRIARYIPKRFRAAKLLQVLTKWQQGLEWNAVYLENHDQPRIVSHYGDDQLHWEMSAKMLALMQFTLGGTIFLYQGQEIGMTNFDFTDMKQLNDIESHNINTLMKRLLLPAKLRWYWIRTASRDNARTPMQWSGAKGAGFSTASTWLGINKNHSDINHQEQLSRPDSIHSFYRKLIAFREQNDTLKYGSFTPLYARKNVIAYRRALADESYTVILNFSPVPRLTPFSGTVVLANTEEKTFAGKLAAYGAVMLIETNETVKYKR